MSLLGADAMLAGLAAAVRDAPADAAEIAVHRRRAAITRYSRGGVHQNAHSDELRVTARAVAGRAVGSASGNSLEPSALRGLLAQAAELARLQSPDQDFAGFARPAPLPRVHAFDPGTAALGAREQAEQIGRITAAARARGMRAAGTHQLELTEDALVNTAGVAVYAPATLAYLRALVQDPGAGYADDLSWSAADLDPAAVAARAIEKCARDNNRWELPAGEYEAVFEELAVAEILRIVSVTGLGGAAVREGRSFMSERVGQPVTGERFTLHDDALDPRMPGVPFDAEGTPRRRVTLVERGVARGPVHDRSSAQAAGTASTGHAADRRRYAPGGHAGTLVMEGGTASREDLIASVRRGILITRFHYTNAPDPRRATMTGTSRDGTFLIENGRITRALANVRYTMSALDLFAGIELLGPQRLVRDWWSSNGMGSVICLAPPMKVARATITGSSPV